MIASHVPGRKSASEAPLRGVEVGGRYLVPFQISCGACERCRRGLTGNCATVPPLSMYGFGKLGGQWGGMLSDLALVPYADAMLVPLPEGVEPALVPSAADNMTDRVAALSALLNAGGKTAAKSLQHFYKSFKKEALVIDKWFALQAMAESTDVVAVRQLMAHPAFTLNNPNRARSLIFSFCNGNPSRFHAVDGSGYAFWAEQAIALDAINPQVAARLARSLDRWRKYAPALQASMQAALQRVAGKRKLSRDVLEVVSKALAD